MSKEKIRYCSLDIETSDFDPANGEILELGMVFFELEKNKLIVIKEWESTFKASKEVSPRILALTGITQAELDESPYFRDLAEEIQELVSDCVIVGHNISFDIRFLEAFGIKFSGKSVDTLDLAQIILPTNPSYNLEALMGFFNVDHKDAHRALADAKAALVIMERMLKHYAGFSKNLRGKLQKLFAQGNNTELANIFTVELKAESIFAAPAKIDLPESKEVVQAMMSERSIITFPLGYDHHNYVLANLRKGKEKVLLVVPNKKLLYTLWQEAMVYPIFENREVFNLEAFEKALENPSSFEERVFLAKVLVWQGTNWQNQSLVDINFSMGSGFKNLVNYSEDQAQVWPNNKKDKLVSVDYYDFISLDLAEEYSDRKLVVLDLNSFEQSLTHITSKKVSWNDFGFTLRQLFESAERLEKTEQKEAASQAIADTDLFFGLVSMHLKRLGGESPNLLIDSVIEANDSYEVIKKAALSFAEKIEKSNKVLASDRLSLYVEHLRSFFESENGMVRWLESYDLRIAFHSSPLTLDKLAQEKIEPFAKVIFTASLGSESLIKYFVGRLHLQDFTIQNVGQQELRKKIIVHIVPELNTKDKMLVLTKTLDYPAALIVPNQAILKDFYETNFNELQDVFKVWAQGFSGGTNKLLQNFSINENSLLIATDNFILRQTGRNLRVKSLVLGRIPFEQFTHPLFAAQAKLYENQFVDFNIPRALYNFHSLIRFFYSADLAQIYILDAKIKKDYGKYFIEYLKSLPFVEIK